MSRVRNLPHSFGFALSGFKIALRQEPNFLIHLVAGIITSGIAALIGFTVTEWLLLSFTISFVLVLELFNTAIEALVDLISPEIRPKAKVAKDVSAAAVLLSAILSVAVATALFIPKLAALNQ